MNQDGKLTINHFLPPIVRHIYWSVVTIIRPNYKIGNYSIKIPPNHALPKFQKWFKLYDRFLPVLAKKISSDRLIIDVGANIGDTTVALIQNCRNPVLCIEPSENYFSYLQLNLERLPREDRSRIQTVKKFIGTGVLSGDLNHKIGGTASLNVSEDSHTQTHTRLDDLVDSVLNVILLKVDTDGFDFDVINSAEKILCNSEPILFWENEISEEFQHEGFVEMYSLLQKLGYQYIYIFDNFGNLISEEENFTTLENINSYLYSMKKSNCTRTIYCTDILASTEKNHHLVKAAIKEYKTEWINK
jgi:FkbM family methyltransferase